MNGRPLSLSKEVQAALSRGERQAAWKLIEAAISEGSRDRFDVWDIEVAIALMNDGDHHGGIYEISKN